MRTFKDILNEEITKTKLQKIYSKIQSKINENPELYEKLKLIDCDNDSEVHDFIDEVLGDPQGIWKNTKEEQAKLLRKIKSDMEDEKGIDFVRPDWSGDNGTF